MELKVYDLNYKTSTIEIADLTEKILEKERELTNSEIYQELEHLKSLRTKHYLRKEWIKDMVKDHMIINKINKLWLWEYTATLSKTTWSVQIDNEEAIPKEYKKIVEVEKIDKTAIKKDIKSGKEVVGASIKEGYSITMKWKALS